MRDNPVFAEEARQDARKAVATSAISAKGEAALITALITVAREQAELGTLFDAIEAMERQGRPYLADPILDPIPFGFTASIVRYHRLRERYPDVAIMMGVGNVTELTEADTSGINAVLFGICAELNVAAVLTTQVSQHARRAVREADWARRIMHAAARHQTLPKGMNDALMTVHAKHPFPDTPEEIAAATKGPLWFQLYIQHDRAFTHALAARAERAGARAIVVTVDALDAGFQTTFGQRFLIKDLHIHTGGGMTREPGEAVSELRDGQGRLVARMDWTAERPAWDLFVRTLPAMVFALAVFGLVAAGLFLKGRSAARALIATQAAPPCTRAKSTRPSRSSARFSTLPRLGVARTSKPSRCSAVV